MRIIYMVKLNYKEIRKKLGKYKEVRKKYKKVRKKLVKYKEIRNKKLEIFF